MILRSKTVDLRRCRPLLGTFVEIKIYDPDFHSDPGPGSGEQLEKIPQAQEAMNAAFAAVERVQQRMSAHDPGSELSTVNREALKHPVRVSKETFTLLQRAEELARESNGAFDCTVAPLLARWGLLPVELRRRNPGNWCAVRLSKGNRVSFTRPLALDLGGIAKGFAVDEAIRVLKLRGVKAAIVNAGGDLRVLGQNPVHVSLRHPTAPRSSTHRLEISDSALATSSPCFTGRRHRGKCVSHLVAPARRSTVTGGISVTVQARECWLADALTKVVLNAPNRAESVLARHDARAIVLTT